MILSKLIVKRLEWVVEIGLWVFLIFGFLAGVSYGDGFFGSLISGIVAVIVVGVFGALIFGAFIMLNDIRSMLKEAIRAQETSTDPT
jgi:uncharacterized membrane protein YeiH